jgi:hypothetical protein
VAMARTGLLVVAPRGRRIGNTQTQRHVTGARHCNGGSMISEWIADPIRIAGSTNPDTLAEPYR